MTYSRLPLLSGCLGLQTVNGMHRSPVPFHQIGDGAVHHAMALQHALADEHGRGHLDVEAAAAVHLFFSDNLRHTWASWHRQAGTSCDERKELGGWKSRVMVDRHAKYATEHLAIAAARIESKRGGNVINLSRFHHGQKN